MKIPHLSSTWNDFKLNKYRKPLSDVVSLKITENLNGAFDLEMTYPIGGAFADEISIDSINSGYSPIIGAVPRKGGQEEPFRIYETKRTIDGLISIRAHHIVYDTDGFVIEPFTATGISAVVSALNTHWHNDGIEFVVQNNGITDTTTVFESQVPASLFSLIGKAADVFGAELSYEYDSFNSRVLIKLNASRGTVKNTVVGYGVNLVKASIDVNNDGVYNYVFVYAKQENDDGTVTVVSNYNTVPSLNGRTRALIVDVSEYYDGLPTAGDLLADFFKFRIDATGQKKSAAVDFVPLEDTTEGYGDSSISLGDVVPVNADQIGLNMSAKVVKTIYNPLTEKYESISVGSAEQTIADTIVNMSADSVSDSSRLIAKGIERYQSVEAGSTLSIDISYGKTFGKIPTVVATIFSNNSVGIGNCSVSVYNITTTGFQLRLTNNHSSARNLGATWIAM